MSLTTDSTRGHRTQSLFVQIVYRGGVLTVRPTGPQLSEREAIIITSEVTPHLQKAGARLRGLVLDMSEIKMMSSFGLGLCLELRNSAKSAGASTIIVGLNLQLRELFKMMKVDRLYTIADADDAQPALSTR